MPGDWLCCNADDSHMFEMHKQLRKLFLKINDEEVNTFMHLCSVMSESDCMVTVEYRQFG